MGNFGYSIYEFTPGGAGTTFAYGLSPEMLAFQPVGVPGPTNTGLYAFTNFAGLPGLPGTNNGTGSGARFNTPYGVAVDTNGNVYVADGYNDTIRKVTPAGGVTTLVGSAGSYGSADGTDSAARFWTPAGVTVDKAGKRVCRGYTNSTIRKVTPVGTNWVVTTLAGRAGAMAVPMAQIARRSFTVLSAWRWIARATCSWRTRATTRSGR